MAIDPFSATQTNADLTPNPIGAAGIPSTPQQPKLDPAERPQRVSKWKLFLDNLAKDPALQRMFIQIGGQLLQPIPVGQTGAGQLGKALAAGANTLGQERALESRQKLAGRGVAAQERLVDVAEKKEGRALTQGERGLDIKQSLADTARKRAEKLAGAGGSTSALVQDASFFAEALIQVDPERYKGPTGRAQARLDARDLVRGKSPSEQAQILFQKMLQEAQAFGQELSEEDQNQLADQAVATVKRIQDASVRGGAGATAQPPKPQSRFLLVPGEGIRDRSLDDLAPGP